MPLHALAVDLHLQIEFAIFKYWRKLLFKSFIIEQFRCFGAAQTLKFSEPVAGKPGSGITYVVGENNSGKTTVLEGLFFKASDTIKSSDKRASGLKFTLESIDSNQQTRNRVVSLVRETSYSLGETEELAADQRFEIVQSRRGWKSNVTQKANQDIIINQALQIETPRKDSGFQIAGFLRDVESNADSYDKYTALVKRVLPDFHFFAVGNDEHEFIEYQTKGGQRHKSDLLGDGVVSVLRILAHIFAEKKNPLVIDEPELSLHPKAQRRLLQIIAEVAMHRQIIVSTHSPNLVSWECIQNGAALNRVHKLNGADSKISSLRAYASYKALISGANWQQPFLMDVVAKEIFFNDDILFVEGQEDVGLLGNDGTLNSSVNIFGYGVRGKNAFVIALNLARDLGLSKAAVVLDGGAAETKIKVALEKEFHEVGFGIFQWNREDIRDKEPFEARAKIGYFKKNGCKKEVDDLDDFDKKIQAINQYFES